MECNLDAPSTKYEKYQDHKIQNLVKKKYISERGPELLPDCARKKCTLPSDLFFNNTEELRRHGNRTATSSSWQKQLL